MADEGKVTMKTVYILGAGASNAIDSTFPTMKNLLAEIVGNADELICRFLHHFYDFETPDNLPPMEDILSQIDFAISENRPLSSDYPIQRMRDIRESLIMNICTILGRGKSIESRDGANVMYRFVSHLEPQDSIVSLNYDLMADMAVRRDANWQFCDYGFPLRKAVYHHEPPENITSSNTRPLYKLHGSLNWVYCPLCQAIDVVDGHDTGESYLYDSERHRVEYCSVCGVHYEPIIITPTFLKVYNNLFTLRLWHQAEQCLVAADRLVFVGYSMPDSDIFLRCMFRRAYFAHHHIHKQKSEIEVVDFDPSFDPDNPNPLYGRFKRLFGQIVYKPEGFRAYIDSMDT